MWLIWDSWVTWISSPSWVDESSLPVTLLLQDHGERTPVVGRHQAQPEPVGRGAARGGQLAQLRRRRHARHGVAGVPAVVVRAEERVVRLRRDVLTPLAQPRGHGGDLRSLLVGDAARRAP